MDTGKKALYFILKSFTFTIVWFLTWSLVLHPVFTGWLHMLSASDIEEKQRSELYSQQLKQSEEHLNEAETQQKRMNALLSRYEQQATKYDSILEKWEKQTAIMKNH